MWDSQRNGSELVVDEYDQYMLYKCMELSRTKTVSLKRELGRSYIYLHATRVVFLTDISNAMELSLIWHRHKNEVWL